MPPLGQPLPVLLLRAARFERRLPAPPRRRLGARLSCGFRLQACSGIAILHRLSAGLGRRRSGAMRPHLLNQLCDLARVRQAHSGEEARVLQRFLHVMRRAVSLQQVRRARLGRLPPQRLQPHYLCGRAGYSSWKSPHTAHMTIRARGAHLGRGLEKLRAAEADARRRLRRRMRAAHDTELHADDALAARRVMHAHLHAGLARHAPLQRVLAREAHHLLLRRVAVQVCDGQEPGRRGGELGTQQRPRAAHEPRGDAVAVRVERAGGAVVAHALAALVLRPHEAHGRAGDGGGAGRRVAQAYAQARRLVQLKGHELLAPARHNNATLRVVRLKSTRPAVWPRQAQALHERLGARRQPHIGEAVGVGSDIKVVWHGLYHARLGVFDQEVDELVLRSTSALCCARFSSCSGQ